MKKKKIIIALVLGLTTLVYYIKHHQQAIDLSNDAVAVSVSKVKEKTVPIEVHAIGTLSAKSVEITPELAGHVKNILFQDGKNVAVKAPLLQLENKVYQAKYDSSLAKLNYIKNNYQRMVWLGKKGIISKQAAEQAEADLKETKALTDEDAEILSQTTLTAPFAGVVGKSKVNVGDYVTVGQSVVTLTDIKHLRIEYNMPEKYLPLLKLGQTVNIKTAAFPNKTFTATLAFISPTINPANRSILVYADILNENAALAPGMFVDVLHSLGCEQHVIMVPARAILPGMNDMQVYKVNDGKAYAISVTLGKRVGEWVEVTHGLTLQDTIITDGQFKVKNGMSVKIKT